MSRPLLFAHSKIDALFQLIRRWKPDASDWKSKGCELHERHATVDILHQLFPKCNGPPSFLALTFFLSPTQAVFQIPTEDQDPAESVPLALHVLQTADLQPTSWFVQPAIMTRQITESTVHYVRHSQANEVRQLEVC